MQAARSIVERLTAQAILPMLTVGVSGAIAAALLQFVEDARSLRVSAAQRR